jgi:hypothetical protein
MSDDIQDDVHDLLVKAFIKYSEANSRFHLFRYKQAARDARLALLEIAKLAKDRRAEIAKLRLDEFTALVTATRTNRTELREKELKKRLKARKHPKIQWAPARRRRYYIVDVMLWTYQSRVSGRNTRRPMIGFVYLITNLKYPDKNT